MRQNFRFPQERLSVKYYTPLKSDLIKNFKMACTLKQTTLYEFLTSTMIKLFVDCTVWRPMGNDCMFLEGIIFEEAVIMMTY